MINFIKKTIQVFTYLAIMALIFIIVGYILEMMYLIITHPAIIIVLLAMALMVALVALLLYGICKLIDWAFRN